MSDLKYTQNFLKSRKLVNKLINKSNLNDEDLVIEIGPGKGIITQQLANKVKDVIAIEYDSLLFKNLIKSKPNNVKLINSDFLDFKLPEHKEYKIFSNIPFNITSNIIRKITENLENLPTDVYLIMQEESAKKYLGMPYQKYEGYKASIIKSLYEIEIIHKFNKEDFSPQPNVKTVLVHFKRKNDFNKSEYKDFLDFVSFFYLKTNTKSIRKQLSQLFTYKQIKRLSKDLNFNMEDSFTKLQNKQWKEIFKYSQIGLDDNKKKLYKGSFKKLNKKQNKLKKQNRTNSRK